MLSNVRFAILLLLVPCGCSHESSTSTQVEGSGITSVDMRPDAQGTTVTFDTGMFRGILKVEPGIKTGYQVVTKTSSRGETSTTTALTVADRKLSIEGAHLRLGDRVIGPFAGEVRVDVKKDGLFVDGKKQSDF
jgi:hypothetical protein